MGTRPRRIFEMTGCLSIAVWATGLFLVIVLLSVGAFFFGAVSSGVDKVRGIDPAATEAVAIDHAMFGLLAMTLMVLSTLAAGTVILYRTLTGVGR